MTGCNLTIFQDLMLKVIGSLPFTLIVVHRFGIKPAQNVTGLEEDNSDLATDSPTGVAIHNGVAYIGTGEDGLNRYILENDTFLGSWVSTGINDVDFAPLAIYGTNPQILHMGLPDMELQEKITSTGEILLPEEPDSGTPDSNEILPSSEVYSLAVNPDTGNLYIGTGNGALTWNGNTATDLSRGGNGWNLQPSQHFGFVFDGSTAYSATNIGVVNTLRRLFRNV